MAKKRLPDEALIITVSGGVTSILYRSALRRRPLMPVYFVDYDNVNDPLHEPNHDDITCSDEHAETYTVAELGDLIEEDVFTRALTSFSACDIEVAPEPTPKPKRTFKVEVVQTSTKDVHVEAEDEEQARAKVQEMIDSGDDELIPPDDSWDIGINDITLNT